MNLDLSQIAHQARALQALLPWDLVLTLCGQDYPTRPITIEDVGQISKLATMTDDQGYELLEGFFVEPRPPLKALAAEGRIHSEELLAIPAAIMAYLEERARKNSQTIAEKARAAMGLQPPRLAKN